MASVIVVRLVVTPVVRSIPVVMVTVFTRIVRFQSMPAMVRAMPMAQAVSPKLAMEAKGLVTLDGVAAVSRPKVTISCLRRSGPSDYNYCQNSGY